MPTNRQKKRVLKLASNRLGDRAGDSPAWPYDVDLILGDDGGWTVGFSEGVGHGAAGCVVSVDEALGPRWSAHLVKADGEWLLPFLRDLCDGGQVSEDELVEEYTSHHGRAPQIFA